MTTVSQLAQASLRRVLVQGSEADLEPDEYVDFIFALNNFMAQLEIDGMCLGYSPVTDITDELNVPDGVINALIDNLAIAIAPDYAGTVSPELAAAAQKGEILLRKISVVTKRTKMPSGLPKGSGNASGPFRSDRFF